jgi:hypothetical protein
MSLVQFESLSPFVEIMGIQVVDATALARM